MTYQRGGAAEYRALSPGADLPLWQQPWWLDAAAPGRWDAVCLTSGGRLVAALPYVARRIRGLTAWTQPPLTPWLGPWVEPRESGPVRYRSWEHGVLAELADAIPRKALYVQNWSPSRTNWLPFYWRGFRQTTRYTYRLDVTGGQDALWAGMGESVRRAIRKARKRYGVVVEESSDIESFISLNAAVFHRQGRSVPYSLDLVRALYAAAKARQAVEIRMARQPGGSALAASLVVRDSQTSYYLLGGTDPESRRTGAQNLVIWESVLAAIPTSRIFDFEGSMIEPIERSFRGYGGVQTPYFAVSGSHHPWLNAALLLREAARVRR